MGAVMKYLLDLTKVEFDEDDLMGELPKQLWVEGGNHSLDYDVIEGQIPEGLIRKIEEKQTFVDKEKAQKIPVGFDEDRLPEGAELTPVSETDKMKSELTQGIIQ